MSGSEYGYSSREETLWRIYQQSEQSAAPVKTLRNHKQKADKLFGSKQVNSREYTPGGQRVVFAAL